MTQEEVDKGLTTGQVAERLGVSPHTVHSLIRGKKLPAFRLTRQWRILESELTKFIARQAKK